MTVRKKLSSDVVDAATDPLLSMQVGEFIVQERIGSGGMGVVYRAVHPLIGKQVAIKVLRAELLRGHSLSAPPREGGAGGEEPVVCRDGGGAEEGVHATMGLGGAATQDGKRWTCGPA